MHHTVTSAHYCLATTQPAYKHALMLARVSFIAKSKYERALHELSKYKPPGLRGFSDPTHRDTLRTLHLDIEEKRLHLTRLIWNRNENALRV